jgi:hypothetical protein
MKKFHKGLLVAAIAATIPAQSVFAAESLSEALKSSTVSGDFRLRYEDVEKGSVDSDGLTLRSRLMVKSAGYKGFSAVVEVEDVRDVMGIDDENGFIPDPEVTEIDQAFIQYKGSSYTAKLGRQVITLDGHRFVGHVGWRQDRQTFDAFRTTFTPTKELAVDVTYIYQRNRIFAEDMDADSNDILLNASYKTPIGKVVGYGYLLDDEVRDEQSDTFGVSLTGKTSGDVKFLYHIEYATQSIEDSGVDFDTDYMFVEGGISVSGITAKLGYEVLGSDDGMASFTTPLATLHKFNGWNDIFLGGTFNPTAMPNGLEDTYFSVGTKISGVKVAVVYHEYSSDEGSTDYGDETGFVVGKGFKNGVSLGLKYSSYEADAFSVDTDKLWLTAAYKF